MKIKITKVGQPCRKCTTPVVLQVSHFKKEKLKKKYFYFAFFKCPSCKTFYMSEDFKIITKDLPKGFKGFG